MATFGKRSFYLFNVLVLPFIGFACYLAITGRVSQKHVLLAAISVVILPLVAYFEYLVVTVSETELIVHWPLKRKRTVYPFTNIKAVGISGKKPTLMMHKKDNTQDELVLPSLFMERSRLLKELGKHVDVL